MPYLSLFTGVTPAVTDYNTADSDVNLGTLWYSDLPGAVYAIRFYLGTRAYDGQAIIGTLYDGQTGTQLVQKSHTVTSADAFGFVDITLDQPILIKRQYPYMVSAYYLGTHASDGKAHYAYTASVFAAQQYDNPPLHAYKHDPILSRHNGTYNYSATPTYPNGNANGMNFFVDVAFDYVNTLKVYNHSTGKQEDHPVKIRKNGKWVY